MEINEKLSTEVSELKEQFILTQHSNKVVSNKLVELELEIKSIKDKIKMIEFKLKIQ